MTASNPEYGRSSLLKTAGMLFSVGLVVFILYRLWSTDGLSEITRYSSRNWSAVVLSVLLYAGANICGAVGWHVIFTSNSAQPIHVVKNIAIYTYTQINKYLPANIFHFVGRFFYLRALGFNQTAIAVSTFYEITLIVAVSGLISLPVLVTRAQELPLPDISDSILVLILIIGAGLSGLLIYISSSKVPEYAARLRHAITGKTGVFATASAIYVINQALLGLALWVIVNGINPNSTYNIVFFTSTFAVAWTLGLITPGASAGLGVRETVLTIMLAPVLTSDQAILVATLMRVISIVGDILLWGAGFLLLQLKIGE